MESAHIHERDGQREKERRGEERRDEIIKKRRSLHSYLKLSFVLYTRLQLVA